MDGSAMAWVADNVPPVVISMLCFGGLVWHLVSCGRKSKDLKTTIENLNSRDGKMAADIAYIRGKMEAEK